MKVKVRDRQSVLDLAVEHTGKADNAYDIALENDISLTDVISGTLEIPELETEAIVVDYMQCGNLHPATENIVDTLPEILPELSVRGEDDISEVGTYEYAYSINPSYTQEYTIQYSLESDDLRVEEVGTSFNAYTANDVLVADLSSDTLTVYVLGNWEVTLRVQCVVDEEVVDEVEFLVEIHQ